MRSTDLLESMGFFGCSDAIFERSLMRIHNLTSFSNIKIKLVDTIIAQLEFNASENELSIFRFPSCCLLSSLSDKPLIGEWLLSYYFTSRIFYQSEDQEHNISSRPKQFINEVLLSYCLLFGSTKEQWVERATKNFHLHYTFWRRRRPATSNDVCSWMGQQRDKAHVWGLYWLWRSPRTIYYFAFSILWKKALVYPKIC